MTQDQSPPKKGTGRRVLLMVLLAVGLIGTAIWANIWKGDLRVQEVTVEGNRILKTSAILELANIATGEQLFEVNLFGVRKRIETNSFIRSASVNRHIPGRITITVQERVPAAALLVDKILYVDDDGIILPHVRSEHIFDLPVITGSFKAGELVPGKAAAVWHLKEAIILIRIARGLGDELYRRISEVRTEEGRDIILYTAEYGIPVMIDRTAIASALVRLDAFWKEYVARMGADELQYIDLRFHDQVVVRWKNGPQNAHHAGALRGGKITPPSQDEL